MIDFLKDYWNNASTISQTSYEAGDGSASFSFNADEFTKTVKKNYGNAAFLSPLPIRIVFSSLFMVEGFVTTSSVQFIKFTSNYVPTICKVTLNIRALYIGFAKEKAYLTDALDTAVEDAQEKRKADIAASLAAMEALKKGNALNFKTGPVETIQKIKDKSEFIAPLVFNSGSVYEWFNNAGQDAGPREIDDVSIEGSLESYTLFSLQNLIKKEGATWDFKATLTITEILEEEQTILGEKVKERVLFTAPLTYKTNSKNNDLTSTQIVENANKKTGPQFNTDRWYARGKRSVNSVLERNSTIEFTIELVRTLKYTLPSGTEDTITFTRNYTNSMNADNPEGRALGLKMHAGNLAYYFNEQNIN
jgi:hypothetical protein